MKKKDENKDDLYTYQENRNNNREGVTRMV